MENLLAIFSCRVSIIIIAFTSLAVIADVSSTGDVNASVETRDKLTDNGENFLVTASNSSGNFVTDPGCDQPDSAEEEGGVYVQVTILSKKVGIKEDGTILLSSLSKSFVSSVYIVCIHNALLTS